MESDDGFNCAVVIPVHNRPSTIRRAVLSALDQVPQPLVVVVDDGSDDDTIDRISDLVPPVVVVRSTIRSGASAARNAGAEAVDCEWVLFLDSDDVLLPTAMSEFRRVTTSDRVKAVLAMSSFVDDAESAFLGQAGSFVVRRDEFLSVGGYDEHLAYLENADLLERLLGAGLRDTWAYERSSTVVSLMTWRTRSGRYDETALLAVAHILATRPAYVNRTVAARLHAIGAVHATRRGHPILALRHAVSAVVKEPWRPAHYARIALIVIWPLGRHRWRRSTRSRGLKMSGHARLEGSTDSR